MQLQNSLLLEVIQTYLQGMSCSAKQWVQSKKISEKYTSFRLCFEIIWNDKSHPEVLHWYLFAYCHLDIFFFCFTSLLWLVILVYFIISGCRKKENAEFFQLGNLRIPMEKKCSRKKHHLFQPAGLTPLTTNHTSAYAQEAVKQCPNIFFFSFELWPLLFPPAFWRTRLPGQCILSTFCHYS